MPRLYRLEVKPHALAVERVAGEFDLAHGEHGNAQPVAPLERHFAVDVYALDAVAGAQQRLEVGEQRLAEMAVGAPV